MIEFYVIVVFELYSRNDKDKLVSNKQNMNCYFENNMYTTQIYLKLCWPETLQLSKPNCRFPALLYIGNM